MKRAACLVLLFCAAAAVFAPAQTFATLASFTGANGAAPQGSLVQGTDGNLYGTTYGGGSNTSYCGSEGCGTVFKISPSGALTTLYSFCAQNGCTDGMFPYSGLLLATDGNFYGTTTKGGAGGWGTVFKITPDGSFTSLLSFCPQGPPCVDAGYPIAPLIQGGNGDFYGTTNLGGQGFGGNGFGTVFKMTASGTLTILHSFCFDLNCTDGAYPRAPLIQTANGNFYGTASLGGTDYCSYDQGCGTIFEITPEGQLTTLQALNSANGAYPYAGLVQATDGYLYGTTFGGGGTPKLCMQGCGTVFKISPSGLLRVLQKLDITDGAKPYDALIQATDGNLYGTTYGDEPASNDGTIFEITPQGSLTTLYSFYGTSSGYPEGGLFQATNGRFYGTTLGGGVGGTVFSLDMGLGPFVETLPSSRKLGAHVVILGNNLTGSTAVSFNGTSAAFTVISDTEVSTRVPSGASSGFVTVTTASGTLTSNKPFRVIP
jgi:uncharacterized repeat protein (TIGR03803 family)